MRKSKFSDEQMASILAEYRAGFSVAELCRKHSISSKTLYGWKRKFGDVNASEVRRMKEMQAQIVKLERIVARQAVELEGAKELLRGKW